MSTDFRALPMSNQPINCITFRAPATEEVMRLDQEGFHYRGQFIADAGEAHRLMVEFLKQQTQPEPAPASSLAERVLDAMGEGTEAEARAAILEVAAWMREQGIGASGWAMRLESEAEQ